MIGSTPLQAFSQLTILPWGTKHCSQILLAAIIQRSGIHHCLPTRREILIVLTEQLHFFSIRPEALTPQLAAAPWLPTPSEISILPLALTHFFPTLRVSKIQLRAFLRFPEIPRAKIIQLLAIGPYPEVTQATIIQL